MPPRPMLDPAHDETSTLAASFRAARPFPHVVLDSFFSDELARRLEAEFPPFERGNSLDENHTPGKKSVFEKLGDLGGSFRVLDELVRSPAFLAWLGEVTEIDGLLFDPDYLGGGTHHSLYGESLDFHIDFSRHPRGWQRRLNLLVYLNHDWQDDWGGFLELREDPRQPGLRIAPIFNRAVLFETSEHSWHGVDAVRSPTATRKSLALYFYTSADSTRPVHNTVYVDTPPGERAFGELRHHLQRRRAHLERLFADEQRLLGLADQALEQSLDLGIASFDEAQLATLRRPIDYLEERLLAQHTAEPQLHAVIDALGALPRVRMRPPLMCLGQSGLYIDRWAGPRLEIRLRALSPVDHVVLCGWCPNELDGQVLRACGQSLRLLPGENFRWRLPLPVSEAVTLVVEAEHPWVPKHHGLTADVRELAFVLHGLELEDHL